MKKHLILATGYVLGLTIGFLFAVALLIGAIQVAEFAKPAQETSFLALHL